MYDPEGVIKRRIILGLVAAVVILAAGGGGFLLAGGFNGDDDTDATGPASSSSAPPEGSDSSSVCGLPDGEQEVPSIGPAAEWEPVDDLLTPRAPEFGPGEESLNVHSCFARNPTGALMALANHFGDANNIGVDQEEFARSRFAPVEGYDANLERLEEGTAPDDPAGTSAQIVGFRFNDYDQDVTRIDLVFEFTDLDLTGGVQFVALTVEQRWIDGDWLVVLPQGGDFAQSTPADLSQYVVWAAEPDPDGAGSDLDEDGAPSAGAAGSPMVGGFGAGALVVASDEGGEDDEEGCRSTLGCIGAGIKAVSPGLGAAGALAGNGASAAVSGIAGSALEEFAASAREAAELAVKELLTAWLRYPEPNVAGDNSAARWLQANLSGLAVFLVVGAVIFSSIKLVTTQQFEHLRQLGSYLVRVLLVAGLTTVVVTLGLDIGDDTAGYLLDLADVDLASGAGGLVAFAGLTNPVLVIVIALVLLLVQVIQFALMVLRGAMVVILAGALPLLAAASSTSTGKLTYQKAMGWLLAWVLYKPVAALFYIVAIRLTNSDQDVASQVSGLGLMVLAVVALPALMRAVVPATGVMGGASGGGLVMAGVAGGVATGAVVASGGSAAAAGGAASGVSSAPVGASGGAAGAGGFGGGGSGGPGGSRGGGSNSAGSDTGGDPGSRPTLQPVGVGSSPSSGSSGPGSQGESRHEETAGSRQGGAAGPAPNGAGAPAAGAQAPVGGNGDRESLRGFGDAAGGASRGAQAAGGASRGAGGVIGGSEVSDDEQEGRR